MTCFCQISIKFHVDLLIKYFCKSRYVPFSVENINGVHELFGQTTYVLNAFVNLVEFAAYFSTRSVRGLSYTLLTAIEN